MKMIDTLSSYSNNLYDNTLQKFPETLKKNIKNSNTINDEEQDLTLKEKLDIKNLQQMERNIQQHENEHMRVARDLAVGAPSFKYTKGPDGNMYADEGEVEINASFNSNSKPEEIIEKAMKIERAALAPSDPSPKDIQTAMRARIISYRAKRKLQREQINEMMASKESANDQINSQGVKEYKKNADYQRNLFQILDLFS